MKVKIKECDIQAECIQWFKENRKEDIIFSVPNEACFKRKIYFERLGLLSGVSDTIVIIKNKVLFIEFKAPKGEQSPEQREFEKNVLNKGFSYYIVRSVEEFIEVIENN